MTYSHIMDPRSGRPVQGVLSVAVLAPSATAGDALDDAFFVLGPEGSRRVSPTAGDVEASVLPAGGESRLWTSTRRGMRGSDDASGRIVPGGPLSCCALAPVPASQACHAGFGGSALCAPPLRRLPHRDAARPSTASSTSLRGRRAVDRRVRGHRRRPPAAAALCHAREDALGRRALLRCRRDGGAGPLGNADRARLGHLSRQRLRSLHRPRRRHARLLRARGQRPRHGVGSDAAEAVSRRRPGDRRLGHRRPAGGCRRSRHHQSPAAIATMGGRSRSRCRGSILREAAPERKAPQPGDRWRVNFSRVQWQLDIADGRYAKRLKPGTKDPLPEDNWVWSPQGAINMHLPERWGYVQFSGVPAGSKAEPFVEDPNESVKWALRRLYYRQRALREKSGAYASTLKQLDGGGHSRRRPRLPPGDDRDAVALRDRRPRVRRRHGPHRPGRSGVDSRWAQGSGLKAQGRALTTEPLG